MLGKKEKMDIKWFIGWIMYRDIGYKAKNNGGITATFVAVNNGIIGCNKDRNKEVTVATFVTVNNVDIGYCKDKYYLYLKYYLYWRYWRE